MSEYSTSDNELEDGWWPYPPGEPGEAVDDLPAEFSDLEVPEPVRPVNWNELTADEAAAEWRDLDGWVDWLRRTYGLPSTVIPPYWHRHDELVWELSALHTHWRTCYEPYGSGSSPVQWHHDFAEARARLRE